MSLQRAAFSHDPFELTAELVAIPSVSHNEAVLVDRIASELALVPWLEVTRVGDNLVARTNLGRPTRVILAGHTDTVPPSGNEVGRVVGDVLWGIGSADMKSGLAVMLELARSVSEPAVDVTYVFYAREEIAAELSGLGELFELRPDLLAGDVALLHEPTLASLEPGCQGTLRVKVTLAGARSHTARAWKGRNAIHRLGGLLAALSEYEPRTPTVDGLAFHEGLQAVFVDGGVAGNVVPDMASVTINHRFAPDRTGAEALAHVRDVVEPFLEEGDEFEVTDLAESAPPNLNHPVLAMLVQRHGLSVTPKLGWTDVSRFVQHGVPAANFGPGDAAIAHTAEEHVEKSSVDEVFRVLDDLLRSGA